MELTDKQIEEFKDLCNKSRKLKYNTLLQILDMVLKRPRMNNREIAKELGIHEVTVGFYIKIVNGFIDNQREGDKK